MLSELLGPATAQLADGVEVEAGAGRLVLRARRAQEGVSTGELHRLPSRFCWRPARAPGAAGLRLGGFSWTQFALPVQAGAPLDFRFVHGESLFSPPLVFPLYVRDADGRCGLLAPLDSYHEQVIAVVDGELHWGWHGDLDHLPEGFASTLGVYEGGSIRELLTRWGAELRARGGGERAGRHADASTSHLSYWTDNGAAYWYRREPGLDLATTLERKLAELRADEVPVRAVELDSWFYPHEVTREVREVGYLHEVPPTGLLRWEPRADLLPDGVPGLRARLGDPPLILHGRHIAAASDYVDDPAAWWVHGKTAHPRDPAFFRRFLRDAAAWGAAAYEQDWLWFVWIAMRPLREAPGRLLAWQRGLDAAAAESGLSLIWCMATPADFAATVELSRIVAIRTCDDYRYADDPAFLWRWFLVVNALADALGLWPFKDCFFSAPGEGIDGDPHPEVEALLSALSAGPVGIGDRIGRTDRSLVLRCCRSDGLLLKPDRPIAALDGSLLGEPERGEGLLWADTASGPWRYVVALHAALERAPLEDELPLPGPTLAYDWRAGTARELDALRLRLEPRDWAQWVLCPVEDDFAWIGDLDRHATMADHRIRPTGERRAELLGAPGEELRIGWWTRTRGVEQQRVRVPAEGSMAIEVQEPGPGRAGLSASARRRSPSGSGP